jgi:hypothetical protein
MLALVSACSQNSLPTSPSSAGLASITVAAPAIVAGAEMQGTVTLNSAAGTSGTIVTLASSHAAANLPAAVTVAPGATTAGFTVATAMVATTTAVTITASVGSEQMSTALQVTVPGPAPIAATPAPPGAVIASLVIDPSPVRGGDTAVATLTLVGTAPAGGTVVALASSDRDVRPPASITIVEGARFGMFQIPTSEPHADTTVQITAVASGETRVTELLLLLPAPGAHNDAYTITQDTTLVVAAPGVLDNDVRRRGHDLVAELVTGPLSGTVTLNADGGFTYRSGAGVSGPDRFIYRALDGTTASNQATVNITVTGPVEAPAPAPGAPPPPPPPSPPVTQTFAFTGAPQVFVVPAGVTQITVAALGAQGGAGIPNFAGIGGTGGQGGQVEATIAVTPGTVFQINVGGQGGSSFDTSGGGGGASDIRTGGNTLNDRVVVAGGGGGGGGSHAGSAGNGGGGGGLTGGDGATANGGGGAGGGGGSQVAGGAQGPGLNAGNPGTFGQGGDSCCGANGGAGGVNGGGTGGVVFTGAAGGGGYYGGGGGSLDFGQAGGGGGGGSSFAAPAATGVTHQQGVRTGNGEVRITYVTP